MQAGVFQTAVALAPGLVAAFLAAGCRQRQPFDIVEIERDRIMAKAAACLDAEPRTVTADRCERSAGGPHDFYSEGDYWWPHPGNPAGRYHKRDGFSNPDSFIAHRVSMIRLSDIVGALASAYVLTGDDRHVAASLTHLRAWFVAEPTRMNPHLLYGQAIYGRCSGRSIGIIDTIHLVEVARGTLVMSRSPAFPETDLAAVRLWFRAYLDWLNTHPYGRKEKVHPNNHGVCWSMQAAAFAELVGDREQLAWIRRQFKEVYLGEMMDAAGGFPAELERTKPYSYSLFVIDALATVAQIASTPEDDLWRYSLADGRSLGRGMEFIFPYIRNKSRWPLKPDVLYWDEWPRRQPSLLFAGLRLDRPEYLKVWRRLAADSTTYEVLRNLPVRHPLLWVGPAADQAGPSAATGSHRRQPANSRAVAGARHTITNASRLTRLIPRPSRKEPGA